MKGTTLDSKNSFWEEKYASGHAQRYPWDSVVSFVFRNIPPGLDKNKIRILEVGFGTASNLWFAAREGFDVYGVEASKSAVDYAISRMDRDGLVADLRCGDLESLPFEDDMFDLVIDRSALTCNEIDKMKRSITDIHRVIKPGGHFLFTPFSVEHSSASAGRSGAGKTRIDIDAGSLAGIDQVCFLDRDDINILLKDGWNIKSIRHIRSEETIDDRTDVQAEWQVICASL